MRVDFHRMATVFIPLIMMTTACMAGYGLFQFSIDSKVIKMSESLITSSQHMLMDMVDAETGQRGFIITGDQSYLDIYNSGLRSYEMDMLSGSILAASNAENASLMKQLSSLGNVKLVEMAKTIVTRNDGGLGPAQAMIETGKGKRMMDEYRTVAATFQSIQQRRIDNAQDSNGWLGTLTIISIIFSIVSLVVWLMGNSRRDSI